MNRHNDNKSLPLTDWRSSAPHYADECRLEQCKFCGCCVHGKPVRHGCKVEGAPSGMRCPVFECGCEGSGAPEPSSVLRVAMLALADEWESDPHSDLTQRACAALLRVRVEENSSG